jgi:hypothetical protein
LISVGLALAAAFVLMIWLSITGVIDPADNRRPPVSAAGGFLYCWGPSARPFPPCSGITDARDNEHQPEHCLPDLHTGSPARLGGLCVLSKNCGDLRRGLSYSSDCQEFFGRAPLRGAGGTTAE